MNEFAEHASVKDAAKQPTENNASRRALRISIPAPCDFINTNRRYHPMAKAKLTKAWREASRAAAHGIPPLTPPVHIMAHIWKPRTGRYDPNNLADTSKACVDGLVDAGLLPDDSFKEVIGPDHRHGGKGPATLILTIEPLLGGGDGTHTHNQA